MREAEETHKHQSWHQTIIASWQHTKQSLSFTFVHVPHSSLLTLTDFCVYSCRRDFEINNMNSKLEDEQALSSMLTRKLKEHQVCAKESANFCSVNDTLATDY